MSDQMQERRPETEAASEVQVATCPQSTGPARYVSDVEQLASRHDYALIIVTGLVTGGTRARTVLTVAAAQKAVDNAKRRGCSVSVALVRLVPVTADRADLDAMLGIGGEHG